MLGIVREGIQDKMWKNVMPVCTIVTGPAFEHHVHFDCPFC